MKNKNKKVLEEYKADMITAYFYQYTRQMPRTALMKMEETLQDETDEVINTNYSCSHCILSLMERCARLYFTEYPDEIPEDLRGRFIPIKK